ncbi:bone morphogenetic protein 2-like [Boleophthalmus pectinirostris]|uniref:bone morphogenetic protein 2-like n=1 Tax=Boleophthalmus pectinirostris TaxID=150288 RepID=UPI000A1C5E11|nr:bone morphogenetic protein 2-like [Boleophthalmus pectinirostris]
MDFGVNRESLRKHGGPGEGGGAGDSVTAAFTVLAVHLRHGPGFSFALGRWARADNRDVRKDVDPRAKHHYDTREERDSNAVSARLHLLLCGHWAIINHRAIICVLAEYRPSCHQRPPRALSLAAPRTDHTHSTPTNMTGRALCLCLLLALQLRTVVPMALPHGRRGIGRRAGEGTTNKGRDTLDALLYLKDLPRGPAVAPHKKAPQFMLDLFNAVSREDGIPRSQNEILDGNIVRSFEDKGHAGERFHFFNLSSFSQDERMNKAEFRWFRKKQKFFMGKAYGPHFYKVDLYEVLDSRVKPWRGNLITTRLVPLYTQGWEIFNVTQVVSKWIHNSEENNGILMVTTFPSGDWMDTSVVPRHNAEGDETNAYLVIFSDESTGKATNKSYLDQAKAHSPVSEQHGNRHRRAAPAHMSNSPAHTCQRVPLFVDFEEIGWSGWIISPRGYNAYHCRGSCPFPLGGSLRATNHATVRSIMHALKLSNDEVGAPCCVPDKLQSISLLYFDDEENVVLKQYDDMVALSCGCH